MAAESFRINRVRPVFHFKKPYFQNGHWHVFQSSCPFIEIICKVQIEVSCIYNVCCKLNNYGPACTWCARDHLYLPRTTWNGTLFCQKTFQQNFQQREIWILADLDLGSKIGCPTLPPPPTRYREIWILSRLGLYLAGLKKLVNTPPPQLDTGKFGI